MKNRKVKKALALTVCVLSILTILLSLVLRDRAAQGEWSDIAFELTDVPVNSERAGELKDALLAAMEGNPEAAQRLTQLDWEKQVYWLHDGSELLMWIGFGCFVVGSLLYVAANSAGKKRKTRFDTQRVTLCGLLLAVMLILGWVERQIPSPYGVKLGLSNSVLIFAVYMLDIPTAYVLMIYKVLLTNLLFGGSLGITFLMGFAGGIVSLTAMVLISRIKGMHPITVSFVGGVSHNIGQLGMALLVSNTPGLMGLLPMLMISGTIFGVVTGVCADRVMKYMKKIRL